MKNKIGNSTYGIRIDRSFRQELFASVPLTWMLGVSSVDILKVRKARWRPKFDRSNSAVFYIDVNDPEQFAEVLSTFENFDFKAIEDLFNEMFLKTKRCMNTGETQEWLHSKFLPTARAKFSSPYGT